MKQIVNKAVEKLLLPMCDFHIHGQVYRLIYQLCIELGSLSLTLFLPAKGGISPYMSVT